MPHTIQNRPFELVAGHPALDLVNTLDWRFRETGPEELLRSYDDLLRFAEQSELLTAKQIRRIVRTATENAAADALVAVASCARPLRRFFMLIVDDRDARRVAIKTLNRPLQEARKHQQAGLVRVAPGVGMAGDRNAARSCRSGSLP